MMEVQKVVAPPAPGVSLKAATLKVNDQDADFFVHPNLTPDVDPDKGRLFRASKTLLAGTVLLVDTAYAIVPLLARPNSSHTPLICSNLMCSRPVKSTNARVACPHGCDSSVAWCNRLCQEDDWARHRYECAWLKQKGAALRRQESEYDFITLWHVVRLLAAWSLEAQEKICRPISQQKHDDRFAWGWESVLRCCDYLQSWPESQIQHWTQLAKTYMLDKTLLPCPLSLEEMISLICKEETNTFGLYPKATGPLGSNDTHATRGTCFGVGLFPRAAMFNHSCTPSVSHQPNHRGQMVFTAARNINEGEECTIAYFDTAAFTTLESRQHHVLAQFRFRCTCERCLEEETDNNLEMMDALPSGLD